jgi:hypothetical protein
MAARQQLDYGRTGMRKVFLLLIAFVGIAATSSVLSAGRGTLAHAATHPSTTAGSRQEHQGVAGGVPPPVVPTLCPRTTPNVCLNDTNGSLTTGNYLQMWSDTSTALNQECWLSRSEGLVTNTPPWPFTGGSGLNSRYAGDAVAQFVYAANCSSGYPDITSQCAGTNPTGYIVLEPCRSGNYFITAGDSHSPSGRCVREQ